MPSSRERQREVQRKYRERKKLEKAVVAKVPQSLGERQAEFRQRRGSADSSNAIRQKRMRERMRLDKGSHDAHREADRKRKREYYARNRGKVSVRVRQRARQRATHLQVLRQDAQWCELRCKQFLRQYRLCPFKKKVHFGNMLHHWQVKQAYAQRRVDEEAGVQYLRQLRYRCTQRRKREEKERHHAQKQHMQKLLEDQMKKIQLPLKEFRLNNRCPHCSAVYDSFSEKNKCCQKKKCIIPNGVHPWFPQEYVDDVLRCKVKKDGEISEIPPYQRESIAPEINNKLQFAFMGTTYDKRDYNGSGFSRTAQNDAGKHKGVTMCSLYGKVFHMSVNPSHPRTALLFNPGQTTADTLAREYGLSTLYKKYFLKAAMNYFHKYNQVFTTMQEAASLEESGAVRQVADINVSLRQGPGNLKEPFVLSVNERSMDSPAVIQVLTFRKNEDGTTQKSFYGPYHPIVDPGSHPLLFPLGRGGYYKVEELSKAEYLRRQRARKRAARRYRQAEGLQVHDDTDDEEDETDDEEDEYDFFDAASEEDEAHSEDAGEVPRYSDLPDHFEDVDITTTGNGDGEGKRKRAGPAAKFVSPCFENGQPIKSLMQYAKYVLYQRLDDLLLLPNLTQQWVCDVFSRWQEMDFMAKVKNTDVMRSLQQRLTTMKEFDVTKKNKYGKVGRPFAVPASVPGSPAARREECRDGNSIIAAYGNATHWITFTANPNLRDIQEAMTDLFGYAPCIAPYDPNTELTEEDWEELFRTDGRRFLKDWPDMKGEKEKWAMIAIRVYQNKKRQFFQALRAGTLMPGVGKPIYIISVDEYQKRYWPHFHLLCKCLHLGEEYDAAAVLHRRTKQWTPEQVDRHISAQLFLYDRCPLSQELTTEYLMAHPTLRARIRDGYIDENEDLIDEHVWRDKRRRSQLYQDGRVTKCDCEAHQVYATVSKLMQHSHSKDYCGMNECGTQGFCRFFFPKEAGTPETQRTVCYGNGRFQIRRPFPEDSLTVCYCPEILLKYRSHINVEFVGWAQTTKYLHNYQRKGFDYTEVSASALLSNGDAAKEFINLQKSRHIGFSEAFTRIMGWKQQVMEPGVTRLRVHLENMHWGCLDVRMSDKKQVEKMQGSTSLLLRYFRRHPALANRTYQEYYTEFRVEKAKPEELMAHEEALRDNVPYTDQTLFVEKPWTETTSPLVTTWIAKPRSKAGHIARIDLSRKYHSEEYALGCLLRHFPAISFEQLYHYGGTRFDTYQEAAIAAGVYTSSEQSVHHLREIINENPELWQAMDKDRVTLKHLRLMGLRYSVTDAAVLNGTLSDLLEYASDNSEEIPDDDGNDYEEDYEFDSLCIPCQETPAVLRHKFVDLIINDAPAQKLFTHFWRFMASDLPKVKTAEMKRIEPSKRYLSDRLRRVALYEELQELLSLRYKSLEDFDFTDIPSHVEMTDHRVEQQELHRNHRNIDLNAVSAREEKIRACAEQKMFFDAVLQEVQEALDEEEVNGAPQAPHVLHLQAPGGTGKTFVCNTLMDRIRSQGHIVVCTAPSAKAARLYKGGQTQHSAFALPVVDDMTLCRSTMTCRHHNYKLLRQAKVIILDEVSMVHREILYAIDMLLRDVMNVNIPFGGKVVIMSGHYQQMPPIVKNGSSGHIIQASAVNYEGFFTTWKHFSFTKSHRHSSDEELGAWCAKLAQGLDENGVEQETGYYLTPPLPQGMFCTVDEKVALDRYCDMSDFPTKLSAAFTPESASWRKLIDSRLYNSVAAAYTNSAIDDFNNHISRKVREKLNAIEYDCPATHELNTKCDNANPDLATVEHMESFSDSSVPPATLNLFPGQLVSCMRNINPDEDVCNGSMFVVLEVGNYRVKCINVNPDSDHYLKTYSFFRCKFGITIPRCYSFYRNQYPLRVAYAGTIHRLQGYTVPKKGRYLLDARLSAFVHGQAYTAFSRAQGQHQFIVLRNEEVLHLYEGVVGMIYRQLADVHRYIQEGRTEIDIPQVFTVEEDEFDGHINHLPTPRTSARRRPQCDVDDELYDDSRRHEEQLDDDSDADSLATVVSHSTSSFASATDSEDEDSLPVRRARRDTSYC